MDRVKKGKKTKEEAKEKTERTKRKHMTASPSATSLRMTNCIHVHAGRFQDPDMKQNFS
jgi:hypothetical protein